MRRRAIAVLGSALLVVGVAPARAMPILDVAGWENLESESRYHHSRGESIVGIGADSDIIFESRALVTIGTSGSADLSDDLSQGTMASFLKGVSDGGVVGTDSPFTEITTLSGKEGACGQPGWWFECLELMGLWAPAFPVDSSQAADPSKSNDQVDGDADQPVPEAEPRRRSSAVAPIVLIILTSGLAAAGFAGWQTFLKDRRSTKKSRRRRYRRRA